MWRQLTIIAGSLSVLALGEGCTNTVRLSVEEARKHPNQRLRAVEVATAISGFQLKTGGIVTFAEPTGSYRSKTQELAGIGSSGDSVIVPLRQTRAVYLRPVDSAARESTDMPTDTFALTYAERAVPADWKGIYPLMTRIEFGRNGGLIDTLRNSVFGTSMGRLPVNIDCANVFWVERKRFSFVKTLTVVALIVGIETAVLFMFPPEIEWDS